MAFEALDVLQAIGGDPDLAGSVLARAQAAEALQDAREKAEAEAKRVRLADNAEQAAIQNRALGDPLGQLRSVQMEAAELASEVGDLEAKLAKARGRLAANQDHVRFWADKVMVLDEGSRRSATPDPMEAATMRAQDALRELHEGRMVVERAKRQQREGRRRLARRAATSPTSMLTAESAPAGHVSFRFGGEIVGVE